MSARPRLTTPRKSAVAVAAALTAAAAVSAPAAALAAGRAPAHHHRAPAAHQHFTVHGLVIARADTTVTVLARILTVGHGVRRNQTVTVTVAPRHPAGAHGKAHPRGEVSTTAGLQPGDQVTLAGSTSGSGDTEEFTATTVAAQPAPAKLFLGTVQAVNGTLVSVAPMSQDDQGDGSYLTVDVSTATVTVDGAAGTLVPGQFVAVLGEGQGTTVLAAVVDAFSTAPTVVSGEVSALNGTQVTLGDGDNAVTMDLSSAALTVNGTSGASPAAVNVGDSLVALGTTDPSGTFTPTLAFDFNSGDTQPVGDNQDSQDSQDS